MVDLQTPPKGSDGVRATTRATAGHLEISLDVIPAAVAHVRNVTKAHLALWGFEVLAERVTLAVSELLTNVWQHTVPHRPDGERAARVTLTRVPGGVTLCVHDDGPLFTPSSVPATAEDEHGRGLQLVSVLSDQWGTVASPGGGKDVWSTFLVEYEENSVSRPGRWTTTLSPQDRPTGWGSLYARSVLTGAGWAGDQSIGVGIVRDLVGHAVKLLGADAKEFVLGLSIGVDEVLVVSLSVPVGADFGQAFLREPGLARVRAVVGEIVWRPWRNGVGITASVRLPVDSPGGGRTPSLVPSVRVDC